VATDAFQRNRENFCYRHPDRQSFVLCQRCMRTICPECQTQAAVGVICPECLRDQQKGQSPAQQKAERRWSRPRAVTRADSRPMVTYAIIGITTFVYLLTLIPGFGPVVQGYLYYFAPFIYPELSGTFQPWRLLTVMLVHEPPSPWPLHIALNMLALWMIGRSLEPFLGRWRFLGVYLISGLGASVAVTLLGFGTQVVGASGAIYGLFGALVVVGRHIGANISGILVVLGINLAITLLPLLLGGSTRLSWQAHVGGLITGLVVGLILTRTRSHRTQSWLLAAVAVALLGLLLIPTVFWF
jgi:membrane associated rhomboid family serine protease